MRTSTIGNSLPIFLYIYTLKLLRGLLAIFLVDYMMQKMSETQFIRPGHKVRLTKKKNCCENFIDGVLIVKDRQFGNN